MRNKIDLSLPPEDLFLNPWRNPGLRFLREPSFLWRTRLPGRIAGFSVSAHPEIDQKINAHLQMTARTRVFDFAFEYATVPVVLDQAAFLKSFVTARDRVVLGGPAGVRLLNRFRWENRDAGRDVDASLARYFEDCRTNNEGRDLPLYSRVIGPDICFAVACRNTFNYYHFITEALCQLTVLDDLHFQGDIYFHFPNTEDRQRPFAEAFVDALFPEYRGRVHFERAPRDYDLVLTAFDLAGAHHQAPVKLTRDMNRYLPQAIVDQGGAASVASRVPLSMNTVNSALLALRDRALSLIEGQDFSHLPRRFYVGRDDRQSRSRNLEGEDLLFDHLRLFGFEYVVFENLSPLEQVAIMAQAEMMVSYHGAGFTNMLFANPKAYVIEIGTLQTAQSRWGDFWPLAHASGCSYVNFFADFKADDPVSEPDFKVDGIVPGALSQAATGQIMALIVSLLGQYPRIRTAAPLEKLGRALLTMGEGMKAVAVLEENDQIVARTAALCLLKADCHKELGEPKSELVALDRAFKADPSRWQTLVRIIWCANRCERPQVIRWALSRLKADFPNRHDAFVGNHEWVRFVA